jgi:hypothetical protein
MHVAKESDRNGGRKVKDRFSYEWEFSASWLDPVRYLVLVNAAGAIAVAAALAQLWKPGIPAQPDVLKILLLGIREFLYGMLFCAVFIIIPVVVAAGKYTIVTFLPFGISVYALWGLNQVWAWGNLFLILVGYSHFACNSFALLERVAAEAPGGTRYEFLTTLRGCTLSQSVVGHATSHVAEWLP